MPSDARAAELTWVPAWSRGHGEHQARALFASTFGAEPAGVWSSPGRVVIIGEHTDYNAGRALATVMPHRTYVAARARDDGRIRIVEGQARELPGTDGVWEGSLDDLAPEGFTGWHVFLTSVLWAMRERGYDGPGLDIAATGCIPVGAGLSGWSALETATAQAVDALWGLALADTEDGRTELAEISYDAEWRYVGSPFGGVDHHTALRCREGEAIELAFTTLPPPATRYPLPFREYGLALLLTRTFQHYPMEDPQFVTREAQCREAARQLGVAFVGELVEAADADARIAALPDATLRRRARHIVNEIRRVHEVTDELTGMAPAHDRFTAIGRHLYRSHASLEVDFEVSSPALNRAVDAAYAAGALGARLFGAGFGGSTLALVRRADAERTALRIQDSLLAAGDPRPEFLLV